MRLRRKAVNRRSRLGGLILALTVLVAAVAYGGDNHAQLTTSSNVSLPAPASLDDQTIPLLASDKKAGFISSISDGLVISFSTVSGKILSSLVVGQSASVLSMLEQTDRRLIAAPAVNAPDQGRPATISIIDATNPRRLDPLLVIVLPPSAHITPATPALFTPDGQFILIATQLNEPALYSFSIETGQLVSQAALIGAPSQIALYQGTSGATGSQPIAISSVAANTLSLFSVDQSGMLTQAGGFTPAGVQFDVTNNPVFSSDGQRVFIAAASGQQLFAVDSATGALLSTAQIAPSPRRVTLAASPAGDVLAVVSAGSAATAKPAAVTLLGWAADQLSVKSEFSPPPPVQFSKNNNVALSDDGSIGFVGSKTGMLFAFVVETGMLQSYQEIGAELIGVAQSQQQRVVAAVHRTASGDDVAIASFDVTGDDTAAPGNTGEKDKDARQAAGVSKTDAATGPGLDKKKKPPKAPVITSINPESVVQGRDKRLTVTVKGEHFVSGTVGLYNQIRATTTVVSKTKLDMELPKELFSQTGLISIQVRNANGLSQPVNLAVLATKPPPAITSITPDTVDQGHKKLELTVHGQAFSAGAVVVYNGSVTAQTIVLKGTKLQATLPEKLFAQPGTITIQVKDNDGVLSQPINLTVVSTATPVIRVVSPQKIDGPHAPFEIKVKGGNFRNNSVIQVQNKILKTKFVSDSMLTATVPAVLSKSVGVLNVVVIDKNGTGNSSNIETVTLLGPEITNVIVKKNPLLAGTGHFRMELKGRNFRDGARVLINGAAVRRTNVKRISLSNLKVEVPGNLDQDSGQIPVVVRNPDGAASAPVTFTAAAPEITGFNPGQVIAGESDIHIEILGQNFRGKFGVLIAANGGAPEQVDSKFVRFVSKHKVIVKLMGKLNNLIKQPGALSIQIVNPNKTTGVPSAAATLTVAAPQITTATLGVEKSQPSDDELTIIGSSFREGAVVDFVKDGQVVLERAPDVTKLDKLVLTIKKGKIKALGQFQVQVVNPGNIPSNAITPSL